VVVTVANLPIAALSRQRAKDVGLVTQDWVGWAGDVVKSTAIGAVFAAAGGAILVFAIRRFGRRWWIPASAVVVAFGVITTYANPIVIDPLFNKFTRVEGPLRGEVLALADKADVKVGEVYEMDASKRTTAANAYVTGIGHTKRVVLYDNLVDDVPRAQVLSDVAHELGHAKHDDVLIGSLLGAAGAVFGVGLLALVLGALGARGRPSLR